MDHIDKPISLHAKFLGVFSLRIFLGVFSLQIHAKSAFQELLQWLITNLKTGRTTNQLKIDLWEEMRFFSSRKNSKTE